MSETVAAPTVAELQARDVPRFDWRTITDGRSGFDVALTYGHEAELDEYFKDFAAPARMQETESRFQHWQCLACGREISNEWLLQHGEAACRPRHCGYPSRLYHYKVPGQTGRVVLGLQYHPSALRQPESDTQED